MMTGVEPADLLIDTFDRIRGVVHDVVEPLDDERLWARPAPDANSIAWLVWHLTRIQDDHLAGLDGTPQVWISEGWVERFGLPFDAAATGYGQTSVEVGAVRVGADDLLGYHDATYRAAKVLLGSIDGPALDRIVDRSWDPPVTAGVRLVSVVADALQHAGQAAYVRGLLA
jgi:hypothetical protein